MAPTGYFQQTYFVYDRAGEAFAGLSRNNKTHRSKAKGAALLC